MLLQMKNRISAIALFIAMSLVAYDLMFPNEKEIPSFVVGCYQSGISPDIIIRRSSVKILQQNIGMTAASYRVDGYGGAIKIDKPVHLKKFAERRYEFFLGDGEPRIIRILPGAPPQLEVYTIDGWAVAYTRGNCHNRVGR